MFTPGSSLVFHNCYFLLYLLLYLQNELLVDFLLYGIPNFFIFYFLFFFILCARSSDGYNTGDILHFKFYKVESKQCTKPET